MVSRLCYQIASNGSFLAINILFVIMKDSHRFKRNFYIAMLKSKILTNYYTWQWLV
jgi:hypothetical protein